MKIVSARPPEQAIVGDLEGIGRADMEPFPVMDDPKQPLVDFCLVK